MILELGIRINLKSSATCGTSPRSKKDRIKASALILSYGCADGTAKHFFNKFQKLADRQVFGSAAVASCESPGG